MQRNPLKKATFLFYEYHLFRRIDPEGGLYRRLESLMSRPLDAYWHRLHEAADANRTPDQSHDLVEVVVILETANSHL